MSRKQRAVDAAIEILTENIDLDSKESIDNAVIGLERELTDWLNRLRKGGAIFGGFADDFTGEAALALVKLLAASDIPQFDFTDGNPYEFFRFLNAPGLDVMREIMDSVHNWRLGVTSKLYREEN